MAELREIPAFEWNEDVASLAHAWLIAGRHCRLSEVPAGIVIDGEAVSDWQHPWQVSASYHFAPKGDGGEWRAKVRPGFIRNGRDAYIPMPADWSEKGAPARDVPLTDAPEPWLVLDGWRNPLQPASISASGGELIYGAGEGYPEFFATIGVKSAAKGGKAGKPGVLEAESDPRRTREIRAMDIVLAQPRISTRLDVTIGETTLDAQTQFLGTVFDNSALIATGGRARLRAASKYVPPNEQPIQALFGTLLDAGDPQVDEKLMSTVWIISPPDAASDDVPDHTWSIWPQHFVWWNLNYAPRSLPPPRAPDPPLRFDVPLIGGIAQPLINSFLDNVNDSYAEASAFLNKADARGRFWSI